MALHVHWEALIGFFILHARLMIMIECHLVCDHICYAQYVHGITLCLNYLCEPSFLKMKHSTNTKSE